MNIENIREARFEARRFISRVDELEDMLAKLTAKDRKYAIMFGGKEHAAMKRTSMDLSRALVKLRK